MAVRDLRRPNDAWLIHRGTLDERSSVVNGHTKIVYLITIGKNISNWIMANTRGRNNRR